MKWDYKVISVDQLIHENGDHDIAVSKDAASARRTKATEAIENSLKKLGQESWELVTIAGEFGIFKKPSD